MAKVLEVSTGLLSGIATSTTDFFAFGSCGNNSAGSTESTFNVTRRTSGTFSGMYTRITLNTITAASTMTFRKNTANGNQSVSIASSATGEFQDTSNIDTVVAGDKVCLQLVTGSTGTNMTLRSAAVTFSANGTTTTRLVAGGLALNITSASSTGFFPIAGTIRTSATESPVQYTNRTSGTLKNFFVNISANARTTTTTFRTRVAGANGNQSVSVGSTATGVFEDTTNTDAVVTGNLINYSETTGSGTQAITMAAVSVELVSNNNTIHQVSGNGTTTTQASNITTNYYLGGTVSGPSTTESDVQILSQMSYTASNLAIHLSTNSVTAASTLTFRKNAANGNQSVSITASTTGFFEDSTDTDFVLEGTELDYQLATGSTGTSMTINTVGHLVTFPSRTALLGAG